MRIGTIGTSAICEEFIDAISLVENASLYAVYGLTEEISREFSVKHKAQKYYYDLDEMANDSQIDMIYIASPNAFHVEQALLFMRNGIHSLIEKPVSLSSSDFEKLEACAKENNVFFMEAMRPMHHPHLKIIEEHLKVIEDVKHVNFNFMRYSSKYDKYKQGEITSAFSVEAGGGALNDLGVYPLTVAYRLFGEPVSYDITSVKLESGVDGISDIILRYEGFNCLISASKISTSYIENEIQTEQETLLINHITQLKTVKVVNKDATRLLVDKLLRNDMVYELNDFMDIIETRDNKTFEYYCRYSKRIVSIMESLRRKSGLDY